MSPPKADAPNIPFYQRDIPADQRPDEVLSFSGLSEGIYRGDARRNRAAPQRTSTRLTWPPANRPRREGIYRRICSGSCEPPRRASPRCCPDLTVGSAGTAEIKLPMRTNDVWLGECGEEIDAQNGGGEIMTRHRSHSAVRTPLCDCSCLPIRNTLELRCGGRTDSDDRHRRCRHDVANDEPPPVGWDEHRNVDRGANVLLRLWCGNG